MHTNLKDLELWIENHTEMRGLREWVLAQFRSESRNDPGHDLSHCLRVGIWTIRLGEGAFRDEAAIAAALLHDLVNPPKNSPDRKRASELSAIRAREVLPAFGFASNEIEDIAAAIRTHSFSRGEEPVSELGRAVQDADRLEALGAMGLFRVLSTGVLLQADLFHAKDPWALERPLDDAHYSVDHFFVKLLKLPSTMKTARGRAEALKRARFLEAFLVQLGDEIGVPLPGRPTA